jgi:acetyl esterase
MPLDADVANLLQLINGMEMSVASGTPEQARALMRTMIIDLVDPATLAPVKSIEPLTIPGPAGDIPARAYRPDSAGPVPTVVYLHGGGFVIGDLDTHDGVCRLLCKDVDAVVVSIDYRLAPEHVFPAAVEDSYAALRWVAANVADFGNDATRIVVGGDSAGGNLSAVCAQLAHADGLTLAAQLLVYPAVDLLGDYPSMAENAEGYLLTAVDMEWFAENYLGMEETDPRAQALGADPRLSPLHAASLVGLAPALVLTAEFDPLRDQGNRYAEALVAAGVPVVHREFAGLIHGFYGMEALSPGIAAASAWINAQVKQLIG